MPPAAVLRLGLACAAGGIVLFLVRVALAMPSSTALAVGAVTAVVLFAVLVLLAVTTRGLRSSTHDAESLHVQTSSDGAMLAATQALEALGAKKIRRDGNTVKGVCPASGKSFGERVQVVVDTRGADTSLDIVVESWPRWRFTLLDYGKNAENVRTVVRELRRRLG
jgi:membrane protein implicated in regulation of membrane protease activity